jgi:peptide/nickel transport system permease protein
MVIFLIKYIIKRIFVIIPIIIVVSFIACMMVNIMPGDAARMIAGDLASEEDIASIREKYGLDQPIIQQYFTYVSNIIKGDLGTSSRTGRPIINEILDRYPSTIKLATCSIAIALIFGTIFGVLSATKKYTLIDNIMMLFALIGVSTPRFYLGLMLLLFFCVKLNILPMLYDGTFATLILAAITLSMSSLATIARMVRSSMIEVMSQDYIVNARAQGFRESKVIWSNAFKNSMVTLVTVAGMQFGNLMGGAVVIEKVFGRPGLGQLLVDSITARDFVAVQTTILFISLSFVLVNLLVDILYVYINPQIKLD